MKVKIFWLIFLTVIGFNRDSSTKNKMNLSKCEIPMFELSTSGSSSMNVACHYLDVKKAYVVDFVLDEKNIFARGVFKTVFLSRQGYEMELDDSGASFREKTLTRRMDVPMLNSFDGSHVYVFEDGLFFMTPPGLTNAIMVRIFVYHSRPTLIRFVSKLDPSCDKSKVVTMELHSICMHVYKL